MYIFNLGFNQKWVRNLLVAYYIVSLIIVSALSSSDGLRVSTTYLAVVLIPLIIGGLLRIKNNYKNKKWILNNLIYPIVICIAFGLISINLSNTNYYKEGIANALSELKINEEEYTLKIDSYNEVKRTFNDKENNFLQVQSNNGDINVLYSDLEKSFEAYKGNYPESLLSEYEQLVSENNGYINEISSLESKIEYNRQLAEQKKAEAQAMANNTNSSSTSNSNSNTNSSSSNSKTSVYIASGNNYYHKTSSCKFIKGLSAQSVYLEDYPDKYKCNCWHY